MRNFGKFIILLLIGVWCCGLEATAQLSVDKKTISVGNVKLYSDIEASFKVKNTSGGELAIQNIVSSNSLLKASCSQMQIAHNESATITLKGPASLGGRFTYAIYIYTNKSETPLTLYVKGRALLDSEASHRQSPAQTDNDEFGVGYGELAFSTDNIEFDYVNDGDIVSKVIYVTNNSDKNCEPNLLLLPSYLTVEAHPAVLRPGRKGYIKVTLDSRKLNHHMGLTQDIVYASSYMGEKASKEREIPVSVVLFDTTGVVSTADAPVIELSTTDLMLPPMKKRKVKGYVTISNTGKSALSIKSLQTFHPALNVSLPKTDIAPGETIKLNVAVVRKYLDASNASHRILMITNDYKKPVVLIKVDHQQTK